MKKVYFITSFDLDGSITMAQLNQLSDDKYKEYVEKHGYVNTLEGFANDVFSGRVRINQPELYDTSSDSWSKRII